MTANLISLCLAMCLSIAIPQSQTVPGLGSGKMNASSAKVRVKASAAGWVKLVSGQAAAVVRFEIEKGWHMYWENPGDSGGPPSAKLQPVEGWTLNEPIYPRPSILKSGDETNFIYEDTWEWILPITGPANANPPACSIDLSWMVCRENCELGHVRVDFAAASGDLPAVGAARLGRSLPGSGATAAFNAKDEIVTISGTSSTAKAAQFIPGVMPGIQVKGRIPVLATQNESKFDLKIPVEIRSQDSLGQALIFKGMLLFGESMGDRCETIHFPLNKKTAMN